MGMTACDLNEKLDCLEETQWGKYNVVYAAAEATMDRKLTNSPKPEDFLFNTNLAVCIVDESHIV